MSYLKDALVVERYIDSCTNQNHLNVCDRILERWANKYCNFNIFDCCFADEDPFEVWIDLILKIEAKEIIFSRANKLWNGDK